MSGGGGGGGGGILVLPASGRRRKKSPTSAAKTAKRKTQEISKKTQVEKHGFVFQAYMRELVEEVSGLGIRGGIGEGRG